jgi:hypothetical protein
MTEDARAIQGDYANTKRVAGRKVLQIIIEVPLESEKEVYDMIGYPALPGNSKPVAVARLKTE